MTVIEAVKYGQALEARASELRKMIASGKEVIIPVQNSPDLADQTQFTGMQELAMRTLDSNTKILHQIEAALRRFYDGVYGICEECEEEISQKRLKAIPWASRCVRCQEAVDKSGRQPTLSVATA